MANTAIDKQGYTMSGSGCAATLTCLVWLLLPAAHADVAVTGTFFQTEYAWVSGDTAVAAENAV